VREQLADPDMQARLAWVTNPEIQAQLTNQEERAQLLEQFSRLNAETSG
jgi:hypothetical protein